MIARVALWAVTLVAVAAHAQVDPWFDAAVKGDSAKLGRLLDEVPARLNSMDDATGRTAAIEAALNGQAGAVEFLISRGADVARPFEGKTGMSALDAAAENGYADVFRVLLPHVNPNQENHKDGLRPIHQAVIGTSNGHVEIVRMLLTDPRNKTSANDVSRENLSPLGHALRAIRANQFRQALKLTPTALGYKRDIVRLLLDHGADAKELTDDDVMTLGMSFRDVEDLKKRAPAQRKVPEFRSDFSADDLMLEAVQREDWVWVEQMIKERGANVNARHKSNKQTALMTACLKGDVVTARKLAELGASPKVGEEAGYTPFHGAGFQGHAHIAKFLIEELKLDPNDLHKDGYRPIHRACWGKQPRHTDFVRYLLSTGLVDPDSPTAKGLTPLQVLVSSEMYRNPHIAKTLVQFGADVSKLSEKEVEMLQLSSDDDFQTCPVFAASTSIPQQGTTKA